MFFEKRSNDYVLFTLAALAEAGCLYQGSWKYTGYFRANGKACTCQTNGQVSCYCRISGFDLPPGDHMVNGMSCTCRSNGMVGCKSNSAMRYGYGKREEEQPGCEIDGVR